MKAPAFTGVYTTMNDKALVFLLLTHLLSSGTAVAFRDPGSAFTESSTIMRDLPPDWSNQRVKRIKWAKGADLAV